MKVFVYPADLGGCGYYRLIWPAKFLRKQGYDVNIIHPSVGMKLAGGVNDAGQLVTITAPAQADVMVFQRLTSKKMVDGIRILRDNGVAVVIDVDDDMRAIHQYNPAWAALHPGATGRKTDEYDWNSAQKATDDATLVTVSTDALLKRYAGHGRGVVLHNAVPEIFLDIEPKPRENTIGWGGSLHVHPDDPQVVGNAMNRLQREGYTFRVVGPPYGTQRAFSLNAEPTCTGPVEMSQWPHNVNRLTVGIAPLNDTRFNEAKSWLKMLEYAALGVPCIGSPRAEYRKLHALGVGLLASNPREWYRHSRALLDSEEYRAEVAQRGREAVSQLTVEKTAWKWWEAWSRALEIQRGPLKIKQSV